MLKEIVMLLVLDIGNTNITLGVFDKSELKHSWRLNTDISRTEDEYGIYIKNLLKEFNLDSNIKNAVICSVVVQLTEKIDIALKKYLGIDSLIISHKIKNNVDKFKLMW